MSTMNQIVDQVLSEVYGYTTTVDAASYLTIGVDADELTLIVGDARPFSRGLVQIDEELVVVDSVNRTANSMTIANATARGVRGTSAAAHSAGAAVVMSPSIPRTNAVSAVQQTLRSSNGLFAVGSTSFVHEAAVTGYDLPDDVGTVLNVSWLPSGTENAYIAVRRWTHDKFNNQIVIGNPVQPGRSVNITYSKEPTVPSLSQDFTVTGLPPSCEDVIRFGASWRLISFLEPASLMAQGAEADVMDKQITPGSRIRVAQYFYQMYRQRLAEEVGNLQSKYPTLSHYGG